MARVATLLASEDGEFYRRSGIFAERFIDGPEFTVLVVADRRAPHGARAYPPAQRLFHSALPRHERFLSYDRYWSEYKEESRLPEGEPFYRFGKAPAHLRDRLADLAVRAFVAVGGQGYGRVDMRLEERERRIVRPGGERELRDFRRQGNLGRGDPAAVGDPGHHPGVGDPPRRVRSPCRPTGTGAGPDPCESASCSRRTRDPRATTGTTTRPATSRSCCPSTSSTTSS